MREPVVIGAQRNGFRQCQLLENVNLYEASVVVWETNFLHVELAVRNLNVRAPESDGVAALADTLAQKMEEIDTWTQRGHTLIIVLDNLLQFTYGDRYSAYETFDLRDCAPFSSVELTPKRGALVSLTPNLKCADLLSEWTSKIAYSYLIDGSGLVPLFRVDTARQTEAQIVAAIHQHGAGIVVFVPPLQSGLSAGYTARYYSALIEASRSCLSGAVDVPRWVNDYLSDREQREKATVADLETEIGRLHAKIGASNAVLDDYRNLKLLMSGSGDAFTDMCKAVLEEFNFHVVHGPKSQADLIARDDDCLLAIEVKGLDGSAKEAI